MLSVQDGATYEHSLARECLTLAAVTGDGNCLFRAFSRALFGDEDHHAALREIACNYMVRAQCVSAGSAASVHWHVLKDDSLFHKCLLCHAQAAHPDMFAGFAENLAGLGAYVEGMRRNGVWGGEQEIVVRARVELQML